MLCPLMNHVLIGRMISVGQARLTLGMVGRESTEYAYLTSGSNRETGRGTRGNFVH